MRSEVGRAKERKKNFHYSSRATDDKGNTPMHQLTPDHSDYAKQSKKKKKRKLYKDKENSGEGG